MARETPRDLYPDNGWPPTVIQTASHLRVNVAVSHQRLAKNTNPKRQMSFHDKRVQASPPGGSLVAQTSLQTAKQGCPANGERGETLELEFQKESTKNLKM